MLAPLLVAAMLVAGVSLAACGDGGSSGGGAELTAVATTPQVGDLVRNVGGRRVEVETIVPARADPHDYEPRPSDAAALADAALVFRSGGDVDEWLDDVLDNAGSEAQTATLMNSVHTLGGDPHWWQDPRNGIMAVRAIEADLAEADPEGAAAYRRNAERYLERLRRLDAELAACVERVPPEKRRIVTTHDSLAYFADRFGIEVVGAVIPSLSTQAQASAGDVERLVEQIRAEGVEAIFPESALSTKLEEALAREADAAVGRPLYADSLGADGTEAGTYLGALAANARSLVDGMSGGRVRCAVRP